jgi:hypothetical protein
MMFEKGLSTVVLAIFISGLATTVAFGNGTFDGETPANEGVCDDVFYASPGLYGLCVAFCEAQDCEATMDPATGEVEYANGCRTSSPNILANYNSRKSPGDPSMPCVNETENQCPCWTESELDVIADGATFTCGPTSDNFAWVLGADLGTGQLDQVVANAGNGPGDGDCYYQEQTDSLITRLMGISDEEVEVCRQSIISECTDRGL